MVLFVAGLGTAMVLFVAGLGVVLDTAIQLWCYLLLDCVLF